VRCEFAAGAFNMTSAQANLRFGEVKSMGAFGWLSCIYPLLFISSLYGTWIVAWIVLGHRPHAYHDDPKCIGAVVSLFCGMFYFLFVFFFPFVLVSACFLLIGICERCLTRRNPLPIIGSPLLVWIVVFGLVRWDPLQLVRWICD
jgi:hypothetical protein